jgi:large subunit ribosomal protein L28
MANKSPSAAIDRGYSGGTHFCASRTRRCDASTAWCVCSAKQDACAPRAGRLNSEESLDQRGSTTHFTLPFLYRGDCVNRLPPAMSKVCSITGSRVTRGSVIHRRGMAKKKGGVGRHVTKNVRREFHPNLHEHRIWVPELRKFVRIRVTARGLKTINKNGAYRALKKAGVIAG